MICICAADVANGNSLKDNCCKGRDGGAARVVERSARIIRIGACDWTDWIGWSLGGISGLWEREGDGLELKYRFGKYWKNANKFCL